MNVIYEHKDAFTLIGFFTTIDPAEGYTKCPQFWEEEYSKKYARLWQTMKTENAVERAIFDNMIGLYAICADGEGETRYWIAGEYKGGEVPEGLALYTFPESDWAVFSDKGPLPGSLQRLNTAVWTEWYPEAIKEYDPNGMATLEVYSADDQQSEDYECGIWVPVKRKEQ